MKKYVLIAPLLLVSIQAFALGVFDMDKFFFDKSVKEMDGKVKFYISEDGNEITHERVSKKQRKEKRQYHVHFKKTLTNYSETLKEEGNTIVTLECHVKNPNSETQLEPYIINFELKFKWNIKRFWGSSFFYIHDFKPKHTKFSSVKTDSITVEVPTEGVAISSEQVDIGTQEQASIYPDESFIYKTVRWYCANEAESKYANLYYKKINKRYYTR